MTPPLCSALPRARSAEIQSDVSRSALFGEPPSSSASWSARAASRALLQGSMKLHRNSNIRVDGRTKNGRKERAGLGTAYREIGVLRPDGVVSVVALVGVPVHRGLFGGGGGVGEEEARVAAVVVGRGSGRVGRARVRRGKKRRRRDCVSDRPPLLTRRMTTNRISITAENQLSRLSSSYYPPPSVPPPI